MLKGHAHIFAGTTLAANILEIFDVFYFYIGSFWRLYWGQKILFFLRDKLFTFLFTVALSQILKKKNPAFYDPPRSKLTIIQNLNALAGNKK